jgi:hypothetical protein
MAAILVYAVIVGYRMLNALSESFGQFGQEPTSMHTATPGCDPNIEMC